MQTKHSVSLVKTSFMKIENLTVNSWIAYGPLPTEMMLNQLQYAALWEMRPKTRHTIKLFGKECTIPREQSVFGVDNYAYSGKSFPSQPIPPMLQTFLDWANDFESGLSNKDGTDYIPYNMVLVNWYNDGTDHIGAHRDDEKQIIPHTNVMTISFGAQRIFRIRHAPKTGEVKDGLKKIDYKVTDNSFLIMGAHFQDEFKHEIPKTKKVLSSRISITLRKFKSNSMCK